MQISIVILLFSDQISGRGESFQGVAQTASGGCPPCSPVEESQPGKKLDFLNSRGYQPCEFDFPWKNLKIQ